MIQGVCKKVQVGKDQEKKKFVKSVFDYYIQKVKIIIVMKGNLIPTN